MQIHSSEMHRPTHLFSSDRRFKLWRYGVGHSQLLLRSLPTEDQPCLDILFEGVLWIELPTNFDSLVISKAIDHESVRRKAGLNGEPRLLSLMLAGSNVIGFLVCAKATAAYTRWTVTSTESESEASEILWTESPDTSP